MRKTFSCLCFLLFLFIAGSNTLIAQNYTDTIYNIASVTDLDYGTATEFSGNTAQLKLDISYPVDAPTPECGYPLVFIIHGGAFLVGSKDDAGIVNLRHQFASRGFVAVAINYRLGFFQTHLNLNCNIPNWNCLNAADEAEWHRAWYRGVQDCCGAIRYIIKQTLPVTVDASKICLFGESAGSFIAMGTAYMDMESEKPISCGSIDQVQLPNSAYFNTCIAPNVWGIPINQMNTQRPDLGSIKGQLHLDAPAHQIIAVANNFGGMFFDLFSNYSEFIPDLYSFHQPNDLIVPIGYNKILQGYSDCAASTGCIGIISRPFIYGSGAISYLRDTLNIPASAKPNIVLEQTNNNADCLQQTINPSTGGHQYDNYWLRTTAAAAFFGNRIQNVACISLLPDTELPNQVSITIINNTAYLQTYTHSGTIQLFDIAGRMMFYNNITDQVTQIQLPDASGIYLLRYVCGDSAIVERINLLK